MSKTKYKDRQSQDKMAYKSRTDNKNTQGSVKTEKIMCYPKIYSLLYFFLFIVIVIITVILFTFPEKDEPIIYEILMICILTFCFAVSICSIVHHGQYLYVKDGKFVLKEGFIKIKELDIKECYYEVSSLTSSYMRDPGYRKWICIYSKEETNKFEEGLTNSKKYDRIQVVYTEKNMKFIEQYLKNGITINNRYY